jgi:hypothetical protein
MSAPSARNTRTNTKETRTIVADDQRIETCLDEARRAAQKRQRVWIRRGGSSSNTRRWTSLLGVGESRKRNPQVAEYRDCREGLRSRVRFCLVRAQIYGMGVGIVGVVPIPTGGVIISVVMKVGERVIMSAVHVQPIMMLARNMRVRMTQRRDGKRHAEQDTKQAEVAGHTAAEYKPTRSRFAKHV